MITHLEPDILESEVKWVLRSITMNKASGGDGISIKSERCRSVVSDSATPWTVAHQAPQSMGFSRQEYWSGLPFPSPGDLPDPGIEPRSPG